MLARVQGVKEITSSSSNGRGDITIGLDRHADIEATRFEVSTIIRQAWSQLPEEVSYPQITTRQADNRASRPFLSYTLNAPASPYEIQSYAEENIKLKTRPAARSLQSGAVGRTPDGVERKV